MRTSIEMMRALLLLLVVAVPTAAVGSSLAVGATDFPMLTPEKCATLSNAPPSEPILERERCSICKVITDNARLWNWVQVRRPCVSYRLERERGGTPLRRVRTQ